MSNHALDAPFATLLLVGLLIAPATVAALPLDSAPGLDACGAAGVSTSLGCEAWVARHEIGGASSAPHVAVAAHDDVAATAWADRSDGQPTVRVEAADPGSGSTLWSADHVPSDPAGGSVDVVDARIDSGGSTLLVTASYEQGSGASGDGLYVVAYDAASGDRRWTEALPDVRATEVSGIEAAAAVGANGNAVYVAGLPDDAVVGGPHVFVARLAAGDGSVEWTRTGVSGWDAGGPTDLAVAPDGETVYVGGGLAGQDEGVLDERTHLAAFDAETGSAVWTTHLDLVDDQEAVLGIGVSPAGRTVHAVVEEELDGLSVAAFDAVDGALEHRSERVRGDLAASDGFHVDPDGDQVYLFGRREASGSLYDGFVVFAAAFRADSGDPSWATNYEPVVPAGDVNVLEPVPLYRNAVAWSAELSPDGDRLYGSGTVAQAGSGDDAVTVTFDTTSGEIVTANRFVGRGAGPQISPSDPARTDVEGTQEQGQSLAVTPDGAHVVVGGLAQDPIEEQMEIAAFAYDGEMIGPAI